MDVEKLVIPQEGNDNAFMQGMMANGGCNGMNAMWNNPLTK